MVVAGRQQVQWAGVYPGRPALPCPTPALPCPVCHHKQTDTTTVAFIYRILNFSKFYYQFKCKKLHTQLASNSKF